MPYAAGLTKLQQITSDINLAPCSFVKVTDFLKSHKHNCATVPEKMNEAIIALLPCMDTEGLNPKQADRIARRRAHKILQSLVTAQSVPASG